MALTISDKQLEAIDVQRQPLVVRHSRTDKGYVVMPKSVYEALRPLIEFMQTMSSVPADAGETTWTDAMNARRGALICKKYESKLTADEKRELKALQQEVDVFAERVAGPRNEMLELLLLGLEHKAARQKATG